MGISRTNFNIYKIHGIDALSPGNFWNFRSWKTFKCSFVTGCMSRGRGDDNDVNTYGNKRSTYTSSTMEGNCDHVRCLGWTISNVERSCLHSKKRHFNNKNLRKMLLSFW